MEHPFVNLESVSSRVAVQWCHPRVKFEVNIFVEVVPGVNTNQLELLHNLTCATYRKGALYVGEGGGRGRWEGTREWDGACHMLNLLQGFFMSI